MEKESQQFAEYVAMTSDQLKSKFSGLSEETIKRAMEPTVIKNFKIAATRVPAYKDFLKKNKIKPDKINSLQEFETVPLTDKANYLNVYPLESLVLDGDLGKTTSITVSSGSSGKPFYWPRSLDQDFGLIQAMEAGFVENFQIDKKKTLHLTALGLGIWTGGDMVSMAAKLFAQKGYPFVSMNTGLDIKAIIDVISDIGNYFDQIIITLYPSFAKDIVEAAKKRGLNLKKLKLKFFFGGEPFAENWRDYIFKEIYGENIYKDMFSCFGSSEGGIAGIESPLCIYVRQKTKNKPELNRLIFNDTRTPSIVQFNPLSKYFESVGEELVLTTLNGLPLIRYNTKDAGSVDYLSQFLSKLKSAGLKPEKDLHKAGAKIYWQLPIFYLFGRSDLTTTIYGLNVYPENIRTSLFGPELKEIVSGKFYLTTEFTKAQQKLKITIELDNETDDSPHNRKIIKANIIKYLRRNNSEYNELYESVGKKAEPEIITKKFGSADFKTTNKLKYVK